jgi:hypothetical protein
MSYGCSDFAEDCEANADFYGVPVILADALEDCDPAARPDDGLRLLAERVAGAFSDRKQLIVAGAAFLAWFETFVGRDTLAEIQAPSLDAMRHALAAAAGEGPY